MIAASSLERLEFEKVLKLAAEFTHSEASRSAVLAIRPLNILGEIHARQERIEEIRKLNREGRPLPLRPFLDLSPFLSRVRPAGAILEPAELAAFIPVLRMIGELRHRLEDETGVPGLRRLAATLQFHPELLHRLERSLDEEGNILDQASALLADLRSQVRQVENRIRRQLAELIRDDSLSNFLQDDFVTQRSGRWVIPVRMEARHQISGVVHDVSRSGETAFVEPLAIIHLSNQLENLVAEQKAEENRILRDLSGQIRETAGELEAGLRVLVDLDLHQAVASLADRLKGETPRLSERGSIRLVEARHPLLELSLLRQKNEGGIVPLDLTLGEEAGVMVITGSNAGGKTVALKTVGLLTLMALSGFPVPARDSSLFPLVEQLLVDIGDEQSIETSLSTFSAHIRRIAHIMKRAGAGTLVLLDELGTSTDPDEGAALACAILSGLQERGGLVLATTHLTGIKVFAERTAGMVNAAMEFDPRTLRPLYRLRTGQPGLSHALEVAGQHGLDPWIIARARDLLGGQKVELDRLIQDLQDRRDQLERASEELRQRELRLREKERELERVREAFQEERNTLLAGVYRETADYATSVRRRMQELLDELRKKGRSGGRAVLKEAETVREEIRERLRLVSGQEELQPLSLEELREGAPVFVPSLGYDAEVVAVFKKQKRVRLRAEGIEIEVPISEIGHPLGKRPSPRSAPPVTRALTENVSGRLNLIGNRVDEALSRLEPFLNQAALGGLPEVLIVHGYGEGILARAVQDHLKNHPLVKHSRPGTASEGGAGATVAVLI